MDEIQKLTEIKILLKTGQISYTEAQEMSKPYFDKINQKIEQISKKFNKKPSLISFGGFMR